MLAFNTLTINDGLSQGMVNCIFQDHFGFMWFATLDGLNRYDGYRFVVYRHDARNQASISEGFVQSIFEDSKGRLWIGNYSNGLDLFDRETETFTHIKDIEGIQNIQESSNGLSGGPVNAICEDKHGGIWVNVLNRLYKITVHENGLTPSEKYSVHQFKVPFSSPSSLLSITTHGKIYYANVEEGIMYKLDDERTEKWSVALNVNNYIHQKTVNSKARNKILEVLEDEVREAIYLFCEGGFISFHENTGRPSKVHLNSSFEYNSHGRHWTLDKYGVVWFHGRKNLLFFDTNTGKLHYASAKDPTISRMLEGSYTTFIDRSGLLWVGTSGYGILKRNILSETFHHTSTLYTYSIQEIGDGKLNIGNSVSPREIFDQTKGQFIASLRTAKTKNTTQFFTNPMILSFATDQRGSWFAENNKLYCYDSILKKTSYYPLPFTSRDEYEERLKCKIRDSSGHMWLGTSKGLMCFNLLNKRWKVYKSSLSDSTSLTSNSVNSLCLDPLQPKRYLWIGTSSGLNRMDIATGKCISYLVKDGLPNNLIYGILNDDDSNLWMSTNKGLACFNLVYHTFKNFDYKDGLQSNEFNSEAYCRTKDGCLFFGGVNGFNYFHPRDIVKNMATPANVITDVKIRNQLVPVQASGSPLTKAIYLTNKLTLLYEQNFVSFEFASMDFTYPDKNLYKYKLEGFDNDWISAGNIHNATYTNLNPGMYTFKVKGSNNDGIWNDKGTSVQLIILAPWYKTWWFNTLLGIAVLLVAYIFYRFKLVQALKLQAIRDQIAKDLHDEVGSNLSNIYIFSNVAQQKASPNDQTGPLLQKITEYTYASMEAMNDIVWMINPRNDRFENIMVRMRTAAAELSETCCSLHLNFDESLNGIKLNMEERKNFYLIFKEAMNNATKYAECKSLWVEMKLNQDLVTLKIIDDGKGFDIASTNHGNGIFNMKKRAETLKGVLNITSIPGQGTTIQLNFRV